MVKILTEESQFPIELANAGTKLVVVDFHAEWCKPCTDIGPKVEEFSRRFSNVVFLKVDVDALPNLSRAQQVNQLPTFQFFRNKVKIDEMRGANQQALLDLINKHASGDDSIEDEPRVKGFVDLSSFISKSGSECLNGADDYPFTNCLEKNGNYLESDCDEQLIIFISFSQAVKLHSLKIHAPNENGPKNIKLFTNQPITLDFDKAESMEPVQSFCLNPSDLEEGNVIELRYVKYQNVQNVTIFIKDNQGGMETTQINYLCFIGTPVSSTDMSEFKRVAGKKGESH
ncbi:PITH domain-containing protein At3g04780,Thioredoxin-like protein 1 [Acanthosepion pharaonis]|uniref:PITH domain-containing protein At3g04780,Thioredoxin-like protein 1 n=1 Tax=Acanthosepion pharaonis TaxID=158019 RepID=A0A812DC16_ACAPH|nr:PITH domain-containing protein At3g04780,Thioredoxin-like protein 1 [Sepia pharaonis]